MTKQRKGFFKYIDTNGQTIFKLYDTNIVIIKDNNITLNNGGFKTNHTKNCMNDVLPSGYNVFQKDYEWFLKTPENTIKFDQETLTFEV